MSTVAHPKTKGYRTIRLPLAEADYETFLSDREFARAQIDHWYGQYPELFPEGDVFRGDAPDADGVPGAAYRLPAHRTIGVRVSLRM